MKKTLAWTLALALPLSLAASGCGKSDSEEMDSAHVDGHYPYKNFRGGEVKGDKNFAELINRYPEGKVEPAPWAAFWWPYTGNGIASASYGGTGSGGSSPAGKYDAARGNTTHAQDWEVKLHGAGVPQVQGWWGHCNGWSAAAGLFAEPREAVKVNGIEFGVADLKALLTEAAMSASADFFGNRIDPWASEDWRWNDTVPDQYFLVLTNYIGKLKQSVLIDRYTGDQVWNQPLAGYRIKPPTRADYLGEDPAHRGVYRINVESTIWWYNDSGVSADVLSPPFNYQDEVMGGAEVVQHRDMSMEIWLDGPVEFDANGKIVKSGDVIVTREGDHFIGGTWKMGSYNVDAHPDYMWVPYSIVKPDPNDDYANPEVDIDWVKKHLLVPGGADDPSVNPGTVRPAPSPRPSGAPSTSPTGTPGNGGPGNGPGNGGGSGGGPSFPGGPDFPGGPGSGGPGSGGPGGPGSGGPGFPGGPGSGGPGSGGPGSGGPGNGGPGSGPGGDFPGGGNGGFPGGGGGFPGGGNGGLSGGGGRA